jgi:hypothetical protein
MRLRDWSLSRAKVSLLVLLAAAGAQIYLRSQPPAPAPIPMPPAESYLVILGAQDKTQTPWNGCLSVTGSTVLATSIWRQSKGDSIPGPNPTDCPNGTEFQLSSHNVPIIGGHVMAENGFVVTVTPQTTDIAFTVGVTHRPGAPPNCSMSPPPAGCFTFHSTAPELRFGKAQRFLSDGVYVARTPSPLQLPSASVEEEDFPSMARSGDDVWVAYVRFVHGTRAQQQKVNLTNPLPSWVTASNGQPDFSLFERPTGGDQALIMHYSISGRVWNGPFPVTTAAPDTTIMRTAVAVDLQKRAWVFYSLERNGNFDLYAKRVAPGGTVSPEVQLTTDPGPDLNPVATTDSNGRVWVAWQGFRNGNLEILAAAQTAPAADTMTPEAVVSTSPASDWDPAIAASNGSDDEVAISWDTYDKGDYDVYLRRVRFQGGISFNDTKPVPVAASLAFEARSSIAYDPQNRLWIAYETADQKWGKDFGLLETSGINLYQNHTIAVRCVDGKDINGMDQKAILNDNLASVLPGPPPSPLFTANPPVAAGSFLDPNIAENRKADKQLTDEPSCTPTVTTGCYPQTPNNSVPRLAIDPAGTVFLAFRTKAGRALSSDNATGASVGSIWIEQMVYFDGKTWSGPGVIANSDGLLDNRPVILPLEAGHLLFAQATDHRLSPPPGADLLHFDTVNSDIYAAELTIEPAQQTAQLVASPAAVDPQSPDEKNEAAQAASMSKYSVQAGSQTYQVRRGDFHRHTDISFDGGSDGSLNDAYRYMIDAAPLQWGGCCDHDNGGAREYNWWLLQKYTEAYLLAGRYTPMFNFERSVAYPDGHRNAVFGRRGVRPLPRLPALPPLGIPSGTPSRDTLFFYSYLKNFGGLDAAHSTGTDQGTNWNANDPAVETTVEIYQGARQSYEAPDTPRANAPCDSIDTFKPLGHVSEALKPVSAGGKGYLLGFESSSDHRSTHLSYANVWVTDPGRQGILDALSKRRVYASTDLILADVRMGDHFMGEVFNWTGKPTLSVTIQGSTAIQEVDVIKDGALTPAFRCTTNRTGMMMPCITPGSTSVSFTWQDADAPVGKQSYYYVRGLQQGAPLTTFTMCETNQRTFGAVVWTSPMWVTPQ